MALWATLLLAVAVLITGGVVDFISLSLQSKDVQRVADKAALAAAHELILASDSKSRVQEVASAFVAANYSRDVQTEASIIENGTAVLVKVAVAPRVFFPGPIGMGAKSVKAEAVAEVAGEDANVCVIALDTDSDRVISLDSNAKLDAPNCAIYSNSKRSKSISSLSNSKLVGNLICSAGGREGSTSNFAPQPLTDCPQIADPLADRPRPPIGACDFNKFKKKDFTGNLTPGVYCDGLELGGNSKVTLQPGVYVIKTATSRSTATHKSPAKASASLCPARTAALNSPAMQRFACQRRRRDQWQGCYSWRTTRSSRKPSTASPATMPIIWSARSTCRVAHS